MTGHFQRAAEEAEDSADEIALLRAEVADLRAECVGLRVNEQNLTAEVESLRKDADHMSALELALESLVDRCNNDGGMSCADEAIAAEAALERLHKARKPIPIDAAITKEQAC